MTRCSVKGNFDSLLNKTSKDLKFIIRHDGTRFSNSSCSWRVSCRCIVLEAGSLHRKIVISWRVELSDSLVSYIDDVIATSPSRIFAPTPATVSRILKIEHVESASLHSFFPVAILHRTRVQEWGYATVSVYVYVSQFDLIV